MKYLDRIAAVELTGAKLIRADELIREQHQLELAAGEAPDFSSSMIALVRAVPDEFTRDELPAIMFRMQALAALLKAVDLRGWAIKDSKEHGAWFVNEAVLHAAAVAKLDLTGHDPSFDPDEFKVLALTSTETDGQA